VYELIIVTSCKIRVTIHTMMKAQNRSTIWVHQGAVVYNLPFQYAKKPSQI